MKCVIKYLEQSLKVGHPFVHKIHCKGASNYLVFLDLSPLDKKIYVKFLRGAIKLNISNYVHYFYV